MSTSTEQPPIPAPEGLSERSCELWQSVVGNSSPGRQAAIEQALRALDRADQAAAELKALGLTTTTKTTGAVHVHPLVKVERECRQQFLRAWSSLHLDWKTR